MTQSSTWFPSRAVALRARHDYREEPRPGGHLRFCVQLDHPNGAIFDVTDRVGKDGFGEITESTEEDFLELTHGDVNLTLDNFDCALDGFFLGAEESDIFGLRIDRQAIGPGPRWEHLFAGTIDVPWSLTFDRKEQTLELQAFSNSKLLEKASAETIRRAVTGLTGGVNNGNKTVTINPDVGNVLPGDEIELNDDTNVESQTVASILSTTTVQTLANWGSSFSAAPLTVKTPYHRDLSIQALADLVFTAAAIMSTQVDIFSPLATYPIATPMSTRGYPHNLGDGLTLDPKAFLPRAGHIEVRLTESSNDRRYEITSPTGIWVRFTTAPLVPVADWTPYLDVEPTTFPVTGTNTDRDNGKVFASDHNRDRLWHLVASGASWDLFRNGNLQRANILAGPSTTLVNTSIEVDPVTGDVWVSQTGPNGFTDTDTLKVWNGAALTVLDSAFSGQVRHMRRLAQIVVHEYNPGASDGLNPQPSMRIYDAATRTLLRTITVPQNLWAWSLRVFRTSTDSMIGGLYLFRGTMRMKLWDTSWVEIADYEVSNMPGAPAKGVNSTGTFLTVIPDGPNETLLGITGHQLFVLGRGYAGVIPYADFDGMSCGEAIKQVALMTNAYVEVDHYRVGRLTSRASGDAMRKINAVRLDVPLERTSWPVWEFFRTSVNVNGVVTGDTGDSQHRLSLSSALADSNSLNQAVGIQYVALMSRRLAQEEVTVVEPGRLLHVLDHAILDGKEYVIVELTFKHADREYDLRMFEAA